MRRSSRQSRWIAPACAGLSSSRVLCMRFDKEVPSPPRKASGHDAWGASASATESGRSDDGVFASLPESMRAKRVAPHFTPFPLPKYDSSMGFGPVRLSDIPDVEVAAQRMREASAATATGASRGGADAGPCFMDAEDLAMDMNAAFLSDSMATTGAEESAAAMASRGSAAATEPTPATHASDADADAIAVDDDDLGEGYVVEDEHFPVMDRVRCQRSLDDLLAQFMQRPAREARTATVLDLANTMETRTDAQLEKMLYELGALFTAGGSGLQFLAAKVNKFGRPYHAADELMKAFIYFVDAATDTLVREQPDRLPRSPALMVQLVHFMALIRIFEPNLWYSPNPNSPSNRTDYSHARGVNLNVAHKRTGEELYDFMSGVVITNEANCLARCSDEQLLDLLAGFGGVMPGGLPEGEVANAILNALLSRWREERGNRLSEAADVQTLERLYMLLNLFNIKNEAILAVLLAPSPEEGAQTGERGAEQLSLAGEAQRAPRGPDFFASVAREKSTAVHRRAAQHLARSMAMADAAGDEPLQTALAESGFEFLLSMQDKAAAVALAKQLALDTRLLHGVPGMNTVARRLALEQSNRDAQALRTGGCLTSVQAHLREMLAGQQASQPGSETHSAASYVTTFEGKRVHPIRTFLSDLLYLNQIDSVFLLHSSIAGGAVEALVSAVQRLQSGKDALIVTASCLREVTARAHYSRTPKTRHNAQRVLTILAYELEKGRAVLLPASEELALHDAGTYCDEDLMLWTVAAYFARELPLVRVNTLMSSRSTARNPHRHLRGEHSPLTTTMDLYRSDVPLLQALRSKELRSVTHHVRLRRKVADLPSRLHDVNPARSRFFYRRDRAMFDKFHVTARHVAPGFSRGALSSDLRGLGFYTPDHPQVPYTPLRQRVAQRPTVSSQPLPGAPGRLEQEEQQS